MANEIEVTIPDIGGVQQVEVIEILVKAGDHISIDAPLITLETDKASMEVPSPISGTVRDIALKVGDKVSEGDIILRVASDKEAVSDTVEIVQEQPEVVKKQEVPKANKPQTITVSIPDIGGAQQVDVIEVLVQPGMQVEKDQSLITLEGDKATMDIPSPSRGVVKKVLLSVGDKVSKGSDILMLESNESEENTSTQHNDVPSGAVAVVDTLPLSEPPSAPSQPSVAPNSAGSNGNSIVFAGPSVRRMARELGVDLTKVQGTARNARITKSDIQLYVKAQLSQSNINASGFAIPSSPKIDFSQFGAIEKKALNKIKRLTGANVHRSWISIPHVTQFDEADITDLEAFRKEESARVNDSGYKLTLLAFVCSVVSKALHVFPQFNASLDANGEDLIYKKYYNIGIAVETPNGLVVPVIKGVDSLSVTDIALEMSRLSSKAREKGLMPADMSGGCFTISSLGGIGGTAFTPIVNSPEVAILGLSRSSIKPIYDGTAFKPRLMLPLSLSYDHRVIDGAEAARFSRFIADNLADIRRVLL